MPYQTIIFGPYILYTGVNGKNTAGVKVRANCSEKESKQRGKCHEWNINFFTLNSITDPWEYFGWQPCDYALILERCKELESIYRLKNRTNGTREEWFSELSSEDKHREIWDI